MAFSEVLQEPKVMASVISVKQLNTYVKSLIEADVRLRTVYVSGEISNFKCHFASGHMYFSLKDSDAVVKAVMFRSAASKLMFEPENGMKVICRGRVSVYERDGNFQLYVEDIKPDGAGSLAIAFEQLKNKLSNEGIFDNKYKKPIPSFPEKIAIVTSSDAAALRDIVNIISRRYPLVELLISPVQVQGSAAADNMVKMLNKLNLKDDIDLIIIGRGGGSTEDLWCFNDETLARTIFSLNIPIISAVGHETDYTICDFVADLRAPTPSAAAELAVPDIRTLKSSIQSANDRMNMAMDRIIDEHNSKINALTSRALVNAESVIFPYSNKLSSLVGKLDALSPLKVIARGYAIVKQDDGNAVKSVSALSKGDKINVSLSDGSAECIVENVIK